MYSIKYNLSNGKRGGSRMEWAVVLVFPAITIGAIALGMVLYAMKQLKS